MDCLKRGITYNTKNYNTMQNQRKTKSILFGSFALLIILTGCKKDSKDSEPEPDPCNPSEVKMKIGLNQISTTLYHFASAGGATIKIGRTTPGDLQITTGYQSYCNFTYQLWGESDNGKLGPASHENLNGKHIKDKLGTNRSIIFPDGTKITLVATAPWYSGEVTTISIYSGNSAHRINLVNNKIEYSASNATTAKNMDDAEADGETSSFEITTTGLLFYNIYEENTPGNKIMNRVNLGSLIKDNPTQVNDLYDDTRLGHT